MSSIGLRPEEIGFVECEPFNGTFEYCVVSKQEMKQAANSRAAVMLGRIAMTLIFGGVGLHQRQAVLRQPFMHGQTLADTTDRFHVWPWPIKVALVINLPALVGGLVVGAVFSSFSEIAGAVLGSITGLLLILQQWRAMGILLNKLPTRALFGGLSLFLNGTMLAALAPLGYTGFLPAGLLMWLLFAFWLVRIRAARFS